MRGKRILLTSASGQFGGMEMRMIDEARFLRERGYDVLVATPRFQGAEAFRSMLDDAGVPYTVFEPPPLMNDWRRRHWHRLMAETAGRWRLAYFRPDLVHVFFSWTNQGLDQLWQAGRARIPAVISVHNSFPETPFSPWHRRHLKTAFRTVRGIYGVSEDALRHFFANFDVYLPETTVRSVVYNFVDTNRFQPSPERRSETRQKLGIPDDAPVIGSVGRLDHQKQPVSVLNAFALIRQQKPDAHLIWIGAGPLETEMRQKIRELEIREAVHLLGARTDLEDIIPAMDLHLLLSTREGFGIVTAEAMACGIPVVGTRVPGTEEVIADCPAGRLVPPGDETAAAQAVVELLSLDSENRERLAGIARQRVTERFSKAIWEQKLSAFYDRTFPEGV